MKNIVKHIASISVVMLLLASLGTGCSTWMGNKSAKLIVAGDTSADVAVIWPDERLRERFARYWGIRYEGKDAELLPHEAPHFREMANLQRYENLIRNSASITLESIELKKVEAKTKYLYEIHVVFKLKQQSKNGKQPYVIDQWVFCHDQWYHVIKDRIMFPEAL